jgi:histidine triad (HIT) family protein
MKKECPFCKIARHEIPAVVVREDNDLLVIMDFFSATPGHILVLPRQHVESIYSMPADIGAHIMATAIAVAKAIKQQLSPDGLNLVQSNEVAAGQTIPHFHLHIVPRYNGDPVVLQFGHGNVSEDFKNLEQTASLLRLIL